MEVLELTATQFIKPMSTGRNRPLLLGCENDAGESFEVVVKFRGREMDANAQIAELITARLADDLGLEVPQAAVVEIPAGFDAIVPNPEVASMVKASAGKKLWLSPPWHGFYHMAARPGTVWSATGPGRGNIHLRYTGSEPRPPRGEPKLVGAFGSPRRLRPRASILNFDPAHHWWSPETVGCREPRRALSFSGTAHLLSFPARRTIGTWTFSGKAVHFNR